jgi:bacillithiol biosynthesis deacetylase BshB1
MNLHLPSNYQDPVPELDLLAISAHPLALEQTAGGTMIRMAELGYRTGALDLSPGDVTLKGKTESILEEAAAATPRLRLRWRGNLHYPDGRLENSLPGRMTIAGEIRRLKPRVVILPYWETRHPDHSATSLMAYQACTMAALGKLDPESPAHRPSTVIFASLYADVKPSFVIDITPQFERKLDALRAYAGEFGTGRDRFQDQAVTAARHYGGLIGVRYGEPFVMKEPLRVDDVLSIGVPF